MDEDLKFEFAPDEKIEHYYTEVCILLRAMEFDPAEVLVTDESILGDFYTDIEDEIEFEDVYSSMKSRYNISIKKRDYIWQIAEKIKFSDDYNNEGYNY